LDPEILIVDEVLAVGDIQFQKKSMARMESAAANEGNTVLFVSHNMGAISALTTTALYLERGRVAAFGPTQQVVNAYLADHCRSGGTWTAQAKSGHPLQILEVRMLDLEENVQDEFEAHLGFLV